MSFSPHYNKLQLKRRLHKGCWGFAFHANLLMYTPEIYLRTKSKNEILKPSSQGTIWKANRPMSEACISIPVLQAAAGLGSLMAAAGNTKEEDARQWAPRQCVVSSSFQWHCKMGRHRKDTLLFRLLFPFCFLRGFGGPSQEQSRFFRCWLLQNKASLLSEQTSHYPPFQKSGAANRQHSLNLLFTGVTDRAPSLQFLKGATI